MSRCREAALCIYSTSHAISVIIFIFIIHTYLIYTFIYTIQHTGTDMSCIYTTLHTYIYTTAVALNNTRDRRVNIMVKNKNLMTYVITTAHISVLLLCLSSFLLLSAALSSALLFCSSISAAAAAAASACVCACAVPRRLLSAAVCCKLCAALSVVPLLLTAAAVIIIIK